MTLTGEKLTSSVKGSELMEKEVLLPFSFLIFDDNVEMSERDWLLLLLLLQKAFVSKGVSKRTLKKSSNFMAPETIEWRKERCQVSFKVIGVCQTQSCSNRRILEATATSLQYSSSDQFLLLCCAGA
jgi:hypothetical protein